MINKDLDRIGEMERGLYSRKEHPEYKDDRSKMTSNELNVPPEWSHEKDDIAVLLEKDRTEKERAQNSFFKKILLGSIVFFILALGVASYLFFGGSNFVSGDNIDILVMGPTSIGGGEELSLEIVVQNNNRADLEGVNLLLEYPPGTRTKDDFDTELTRHSESFGDISSNSEVKKTVKSVLFGEKDSIKTIKMTLEYRIKGSSAVFFKDKNYEISIKSSPILVTVENPSEVNSNEPVEFVVKIVSNSADTIRNLLLRVEYPFGFAFQSANPKPTSDNSLWELKDLPSGGNITLRIKGILQGQSQEERTFHFFTGLASEKNERELGAIFSLISPTVSIQKPFLTLDVALAGNSASQYIAKPGEKIQTNIVWTNNLSNQLLDAKVEVEFSGNALDKTSVRASGGGFYRSIDNTIEWDRKTTPELNTLNPGDDSLVNFSFSPLGSFAGGVSNQEINMKITVSGRQVADNGKSENISVSKDLSVKIGSTVNVAARLVRSLGSFENSGPIPPRADSETTYTVIWSLTNSLNSITNAKVVAKLPPNVKWTNLSSPQGENFDFDEQTNEVIWLVGDLRSGAGFTNPLRQMVFQISFLPSLSQVGTSPVVLEESMLIGKDSFTGQDLEVVIPALTTKFITDPDFDNGDDVVIK